MSAAAPSPSPSAQELLAQGPLAPLLPMLYVAWADGTLSAEELDSVRELARAQPWLGEEARGALARWLDPRSPPDARALAQLRRHLKARMAADAAAPGASSDLASLGAQLSGAPPELLPALGQVQRALGLQGPESTRLLLPRPGVKARPQRPAASFDASQLRALLSRTYPEVRERVRRLLEREDFRYVDERDTGAYREQVLSWLRALGDAGLGRLAFPSLGEAQDLGAFITAFETLALFDLSLTVKAGVQFGLFGGSVYFLGTERHHALLPAIASVQLPGAFAMSELGHGSNVRDLRTLARYEPATQEFVVHTPDESARKEWIGNAAAHGRMATVFAQLEVGGEQHGVHALLVPLRDEGGRPLPGVRIEDCGRKMGLNGVDNGRLWFDQVRVPRENLLDRFAQVSPEGEYTSAIASTSKRFFTMLGTLVAGRVSVAHAANSVAKSALTIALRYADTRRQFGPAQAPQGPEGAQLTEAPAEVRLLDYPTHQLRLLVPLARTYGLDFALKHLVARYVARTEKDAQEVEGLAAGLKAYASSFATQAVQTAREACGGQGYLVSNRLPSLKADSDIFTTFEGDNTVLLQLVAKGLLTGYRQQFEDDRVGSLVRLVLERAATAVTDRNPIAARRTGSEHLRDGAFHLRALRYREQDLLASVAARLRKRLGDGMEAFEAFNQVQPHLVALAHAHVERVVLEQFQQGVEALEQGPVRAVLSRLCDLYALSCLEAASGWFLAHDYLEAGKWKAVRSEVERLCAELAPDAVALTDAFGIPDTALAAPIAFGAAG
ncbi:acyl-CoA oxidase [Aggregicoccus sp. 17bor-14]|uniref:acyl-CoA dehydrogenase family protein n=1 Tax=Myxococcaceae TaxID=31 RepID=UPI00129C19D7|nr:MULTISPECIES: acyl-CoA dehydrogenase [Myxococcaceae]MBF5042902.1 acyl-CoA dehydrogenase family protein [Simulacricoccus sp. 17bor-14]MRI88669.1 acyl-CoA oxidase [Aggregicoccus sp. 17bor-14]